MLTATYSLVAIANEQNKMRRLLQKVQQHLRNAWEGLHHLNLTHVKSVFNDLRNLDSYCHRRKVEIHLIPAIRSTTDAADPLLAELESLSVMGMRILRSIGEQLERAFEAGGTAVAELCRSMERYCHELQKRLAKEEQELLPLVRRLFSTEEWFPIAAKFLSEDGQVRGPKHCSPPPRLRGSLSR